MRNQFLISLAGAALIALCGCGGTPERARSGASPGTKRAASARVRPEIRNAGVPVRKAPYRARSFRPIGTGTLTLDGNRHNFQVADCRLEPEKLPSGWVRDIWVTAAGKISGEPFFLKLNRATKGGKTNLSLAAYLAPLPKALEPGGYNVNRPEGLATMEAVNNMDSFRSFGLSGLRNNQMKVQGGTVETTSTFKMRRFNHGTFTDDPPVEARLELICIAYGG